MMLLIILSSILLGAIIGGLTVALCAIASNAVDLSNAWRNGYASGKLEGQAARMLVELAQDGLTSERATT